jgi:hypothetical protein
MKLTSLPPPLAGLNYRTDYVGFVVYKMALEELFPIISILHIQYQFTTPV